MTNEAIQGFSISPLQHHLWRSQGAEHVGEHFATLVARVDGSLGPADLERALREVLRGSEILRTVFPMLPGTHVPVQSIREECEVSVVALAGPPAAALAELTAAQFDLASGPLLRVALTQEGGSCHLVLVQPTMTADRVSLWNLVRELGAALRGETASPAADGEEAPMQFADIAQWLHDNLESEDAQEGLAHWRALDLSLATASLPLAFDRGPEVRGVGRVGSALSAGMLDDAAALAQRLGVARSTVFFAAWCAFLARTTERGELVVGDQSEGRGYEGLSEALGPYGRMLPIDARVDLGPHGSTLEELVRALDEARSRAGDFHETFDFERAGAAPDQVLDLTFLMHREVEPVETGGATLTLVERRADAEPGQLGLELDLGHRTPRLELAYGRRWLTEADARAMADSFGAFLAAAIAAPSEAVACLPVLSNAMRDELLTSFSPGLAAETPDTSVSSWIERVASKEPDAVAVEAPDGRLTYSELTARARRIARHLRSLGVVPGTFVGLHLGRSTDLVAGILGTLEAGAAYLPLPPEYPAERIAFMLEDTAAPVVLSTTSQASELPADGDRRVILLDDCAELEAQSADALEPVGTLDDPAYVIFTSGSTGKPKGVPIPHRSLAHSTEARTRVYQHPVECFLLVSSFAFDSSVAGIFWTLSQGGRLVLPEDGFEQEIGRLASLFQAHGVTHTLGLPSLHKLVLENAAPGELSTLKTVVVAGESCPPELLRLHAEVLPGVELYNEYGPTECTVWSTCFDCRTPFERRSVPIGRPIPRAAAYVVDERDALCPVGVAGELCVGGAGVADGYLGRPELTAERFVELDFGTGESARVYRTGDRVRWLPDGNLEFLGRTDHQVKLRGYRIELEEIDAVLAAHPGVREAVVLAREDTPGDLRLVAYAQPRAGCELDPASLRDHLAGPLPDYMVPAHFVILPELPLLPNGKVNRKSLPAPDQATSLVRAAYVEPTKPLEKVLAIVWSDVLGADRVGLDDDFFNLGGHSILATQLFARIVELLGVRVQLRAIFDVRTLGGLAAHMEQAADEPEVLTRTAEVVLEALAG